MFAQWGLGSGGEGRAEVVGEEAGEAVLLGVGEGSGVGDSGIGGALAVVGLDDGLVVVGLTLCGLEALEGLGLHRSVLRGLFSWNV